VTLALPSSGSPKVVCGHFPVLAWPTVRYRGLLRAGHFGIRAPGGGGTTCFFTPVQTGPGAHPASSIMGNGFPGVKRPGRGIDYRLPSVAKVENG
jgi:hypothetical protein